MAIAVLKHLGLSIVALGLVSATAHANQKATDIIEASVNGYINLAYRAFTKSAGEMDDRLVALCATPSQASLDAARDGFRNAADTFSYVELVRFGPITKENRLERLLFWPDRKGIGLKQVQAAIAEKDEDATDADKLSAKSVAMQGFGALEFVLFGTGSDDLSSAAGDYRCRFGEAIASNIAGMAGDVEAEWADPNGFAKDWAHPGPGSSYQTGTEAVTELLEVFVNGLELVRDVRTNGFLGEKPDGDRPKQAIYWRSQGTANSLEMNMKGLRALFDASTLGDKLPEESRWIAQSIDFQLGEAANAAKAATGVPIDQALADPAKRGKLDYYRIVTSGLSDLFAKRLAGEFGLTAGFSSLDGD